MFKKGQAQDISSSRWSHGHAFDFNVFDYFLAQRDEIRFVFDPP